MQNEPVPVENPLRFSDVYTLYTTFLKYKIKIECNNGFYEVSTAYNLSYSAKTSLMDFYKKFAYMMNASLMTGQQNA